ncbi:holo-ACP synthase [Klugiella xanthotipulae]|uniref:Holo-[acyl-carrier-protein] synthase n=1 Tax=Klugiella xanthotipulae TaxID=244735 RepID=A0A543I599_9MICO|nr:holo-ACP synthase [Klugiella xanthotipulae]TQM65731.1 holo-[acyl-carrier protein] synthase [Klugiella xanthotipulae]
MIIGIGVDTVEIARFERSLDRTPALAVRLFTEAERGLPVRSLAARFAAKESLIKALGGSDGVSWHDLVVPPRTAGRPAFELSEGLRAALAAVGGDRVHLSLTHDGGMATAFVVVEGGPHDRE